ncbi:MAG: glycosyltransferase [Arenicellales bacterium]
MNREVDHDNSAAEAYSKLTTESFIEKAPLISEAYDTSTQSYREYVREVIDWFENNNRVYASIDAEAHVGPLVGRELGFCLALKIAESHRILHTITEPVTITLLNPVYKETNRMKCRGEHPHGEDSIRFKMDALAHLENLNPMLSCRFFVIDDGCPNGSGNMAQAILNEDYSSSVSSGKARVYFLAEAINADDPDLPPGLTHKDGPNRSVKGGAILFGMRKALADDSVTGLHIIIDNDADLSVHPEQIGLLIDPLLLGRADAVAGSRREKDSAALIGGSRNSRGRLFIQIWQHLLPELSNQIVDTNRAFKAFTSSGLQRIIDRIGIYTFPYQIELLQACISEGVLLEKRGIAYVDSEAASTQQGDTITETYLHQIHQIADIAHRYKTIDLSDPILKFLETTDEKSWLQIESNPPERIEDLLT